MLLKTGGGSDGSGFNLRSLEDMATAAVSRAVFRWDYLSLGLCSLATVEERVTARPMPYAYLGILGLWFQVPTPLPLMR